MLVSAPRKSAITTRKLRKVVSPPTKPEPAASKPDSQPLKHQRKYTTRQPKGRFVIRMTTNGMKKIMLPILRKVTED
jgi:hypothetical protein